MNKRFVRLFAPLVFCAAATGCGTPPGFYPVSGKILYKGEPAPGAVVYFHRTAGVADPRQVLPVGIADEDGGFYLTCDGVGDGCPPGQYAVLVEWRGKPETPVEQPRPTRAKGKGKVKVREVATNRQMARQGVDRLKGRYFDIAKPLLHAEVLPRTNTLPPFELDE
jgi:hypothetical protein